MGRSALLLLAVLPLSNSLVVPGSQIHGQSRRALGQTLGQGAAVAAASLLVPGGAAPALAAEAAVEKVVTLNDGAKFPVVSFGLQVYDDTQAYKYTKWALEAGYRNFFASVLADNQRGFARAIQESSVPRSDLFICGSVLSNRARGFEAARQLSERGCKENMEAFATGGIGYIDQIMLDYPGPDADSIRGQWAALEAMKASKLVGSLAVSNFSPAQLDVLLADKAATRPAVNQLPIGVGFRTAENAGLLRENAARGVRVQAWSPLRTLGPKAKAACGEIGAAKGGKSAQQVALRWLLQSGVAFTTQSTKKNHVQEGVELFDFSLSAAEMARLDAVEG